MELKSLEDAIKILEASEWSEFGEVYEGAYEDEEYFCMFFKRNQFNTMPNGVFLEKKTGKVAKIDKWVKVLRMGKMKKIGDWSIELIDPV